MDNGRFHRNLLTIQDEWKNIWIYVLETGAEDIGKNWSGTYSRCMKALHHLLSSDETWLC
jgi:hypothetical protein